MKFDDIKFEDSLWLKGKMARVFFPNGYGASIVCHVGSYGGSEGLFEIAVLHAGEICYDTPVTNDVIGWLSPNGVEKTLAEIEALPPTAGKKPEPEVSEGSHDAVEA